jgi:hypothetical protein
MINFACKCLSLSLKFFQLILFVKVVSEASQESIMLRLQLLSLRTFNLARR